MKIFVYVDMNAFFVSCHQLETPELENKPVVVSSNSRRAVICSASYETRKYGIKSAMPLFKARELCPELILIPVNFKLYQTYSNKIFIFLSTTFTNKIEQTSIDEYCLDITNIYQQYENIESCAEAIQNQLLTTLRLSCSIGVSFTKVLAKIASKLKKPAGISLIMPDNLKTVLYPLPIEEMIGIGPKTSAKLHELKINTIGDLALYEDGATLTAILGKRYFTLQARAQGIVIEEDITINEEKKRKSVGRDYTLEYDSNHPQFLCLMLRKIAIEVANRMKKQEVAGKTILCGFKINRDRWISKQTQLKIPTNDPKIIYETSIRLFIQIWKYPQKIRALRIAVKNLN